MIRNLSTVLDEQGADPGPAVTVRCRVRSEPMPGESAGEKTVYRIDDPYHDLDEQPMLSLWADEPPHEGIERTAPYVLSTLGLSSGEDEKDGDRESVDDKHDGNEAGSDGVVLQRGEELLVRGIPNRRGGDDAFYLNVTSFVIRDPDRLISKSRLRTQERCPREYYLRYVKRVYPGDKFDAEPWERAAGFRGEAVHKLTENALEEHLDRFREDTWTPDTVESFCEEQFETEFGFRQALLVISGAGLDAKDHAVEAVTRLFTDSEFCERVAAAEEVGIEQFLANEYGYAGRVDVLLDGTPYDVKTTRDPEPGDIGNHSRQIKLYLFALLLERLEPGESFREAVEAGLEGYLLYPNVDADDVRFEPVALSMDDVRRFLHARNDVVETGDAFAPPSTYNRECEGCSFAVEEWVSGADDTLPPACTYHCQNERRWPCYETDGGRLTTQCSLFDTCEERTKYRDPDVIDHYESVRVAFREERRARVTARRALDTFDDELLVEGGYRVPDLECVGARAAGSVVRFETSRSIVPAFQPGEVVQLDATDGSQSTKAVYFGRDDGEFLFSPLEPGSGVGDYLTGGPYEATYSFSVDSIDDRHLPYLDFAQRRNAGDQLVTTTGDSQSEEVPSTVSPSAVSSYLDREQVFVDLPVSTSRNELLAELIHELVTAAYPALDGNGTVPAEGRRALVLGATPGLAEVAATAQPEGEHYRLDGTGGPDTIQNEDGYHEIQTRLLDSRSLVSTVQQATGVAGPGGIREFFHRLEEGEFGDRDHSENFFDVLVVLGAERLTEPEHHFLADVADRVVAIGDTRRGGPRLLSRAATEAGLDVYFEGEFDRYRSFPTDDAVSLQIEGEAPPALRQFYRSGPWTDLDGDLQFLNIEGDEEAAVETVELEASVPAVTGSGLRLVFDVTDTPVSPMAAHELFEDRLELDATALREGTTVVLDDESFFLRSKESLDGENPTHHQVVIRAEASELPQFSRALLSNRIAEGIVASVAGNDDPDVIVTPFERHGARIAEKLEEAGVDVPVRRPEELDGTIAGHAVVSLATANEDRIVRPPLDEPAVLYSLLASGRDLTLVGNEETLRSKDVFDELIDSASSYSE